MTRGAWGALLAALGAGAGFGALYLYERSRTETLPPTLTPPSTGGPPPSQQPSTPPSYTPPPSSPPTTGLTCGQQILMGQLLLEQGSTGACVQQLQSLLDQWGDRYGFNGFPNGTAIAQDGVFGPLTEQAVKAFQSRVGITVDGIVGPQTWNALTSMTAPTIPTVSPPSSSSSSGGGFECAYGYFKQTFTQITGSLGSVYSGTWTACLPAVPTNLPADIVSAHPILAASGCATYLSLGPIVGVNGSDLSFEFNPTPVSQVSVYGVATYINGHLTQVSLQLNNPGPKGQLSSNCVPLGYGLPTISLP